MTSTLLEPEVERKLAAMWSPGEERASARAALSRYGVESYGLEIERPNLSEEQRRELEALRARDRAQLDAWRRK